VCSCGVVLVAVVAHFINNCGRVRVAINPHRRPRNKEQGKTTQKIEEENGQSSQFVRAAYPQGLPSRGHTLAEFTQKGRTFAQVNFVLSHF
jgi:hypothetical protein